VLICRLLTRFGIRDSNVFRREWAQHSEKYGILPGAPPRGAAKRWRKRCSILPRPYHRSLRRIVEAPSAGYEYVKGWAVLALPFDTGHVLGLRQCFAPTGRHN
jgi:hypothetical protein